MYKLSHHNPEFETNPKARRIYRLLEMLPGALTWLIFIFLFTFSFIKPLWVVYIIILYSFLWLVRVAYFVFYFFIAWNRYRTEEKTDWMEKVKKQDNWDSIYHAIFLPNYKEPAEVLEHTFQAIKDSTYPHDKIIVILGGEERAGDEFPERVKQIKKTFNTTFHEILITVHPDNLPGELKGKGANMHYMGKQLQQYVDEQGIVYENIIVSAFDCDTAPHPQYFARVAHAYLTNPDPTKSSYQPLALYNNNIWESPSFTRVVANSTTFWLMTELTRPEQFMTFSSHAMSFKTLVDVGFWEKDIVTEDSRIFLQCFLKYHGNYSLVPMYIPVNMDTVAVSGTWRTIVNQYKQMQRWAWSVEHQPYLIYYFSKDRHIPLNIKLRYVWKLVEGQLSWATAPILLTIFSRLPLHIASQQHNTSVLVQNAPFLIETLLQLAMVGMIISVVFNMMLLPQKPPKHSYIKYVTMVLQWILLPITLIVFGSIPAVDAQTRLMLGKYLGFWNTEKTRKK